MTVVLAAVLTLVAPFDCDLDWLEPVCPLEPAPGAGATAGGPYADTLTATEEAWRPLVARYFCGHAEDEAMHVMACESNGDADVVNSLSGTTGLFQIHPMHFDDMDGVPTDPESNVEHARDLYVRAGGWFDFHCRPVP